MANSSRPYDFRITRANRVREARDSIQATFNDQRIRVFSPQELARLFQEHRDKWWILSNVTSKNFIEYLQTELGLKQIILSGETHQQKFIRYLWGEATPIEVASTIRASAYLCHSSAVFVHGLTNQLPR